MNYSQEFKQKVIDCYDKYGLFKTIEITGISESCILRWKKIGCENKKRGKKEVKFQEFEEQLI